MNERQARFILAVELTKAEDKAPDEANRKARRYFVQGLEGIEEIAIKPNLPIKAAGKRAHIVQHWASPNLAPSGLWLLAYFATRCLEAQRRARSGTHGRTTTGHDSTSSSDAREALRYISLLCTFGHGCS